MHFHMHGRGGRGCGPRGSQNRWSPFEGAFADRWEAAREGGRGRRMFDGSELRLVLLKLIADAPRHGYELIKAIEEMTGGAYAPSPGVVYPSLAMLDEMGQIEEQASEGAKKRFAATAEGHAFLAENAEQVAALIGRLTEIGARRSRHDAMPVRRAMGNLRLAVQGRLMNGGFGPDLVHDVAAMLDDVAQKIERL